MTDATTTDTQVLSDRPEHLLKKLVAEVASELNSAERTQDFAAQLPTADDGPLRVALVGPYSAGKTLMIGALLAMPAHQLDDLVAAAPKTTRVTPYAWHDLVLLDLPGTLSGLEDHDVEAQSGMRQADALVIVTTVELSGEAETRQISRLLSDEGFLRRAIIVVNKMNAENSDRAVILDEVEKRLGRHAHAVPVVLTDVRDYVDAYLDADLSAEERDLLTADSGVPELINAIETLASSDPKSVRGEAHTFEVIRVIREALDAWTFTEGEEEAVLLSQRIAAAIRRARQRLVDVVATEAEAVNDAVRASGSRLANAVSLTDGSISTSERDRSSNAFDTAVDGFENAFNSAIDDVAAGLNAELSEAVADAIQHAAARASAPIPNSPVADPNLIEKLMKEAFGVLPAWLEDALKEFADGGKRSGSAAHKVARWINGALGRTPKPYVHQNLADKLVKGAKGAKWMAKVIGPALDLGGVLTDELRRRKIDNYRKKIQADFDAAAQDLATTLRTNAEADIDAWLKAIETELSDAVMPGQSLSGAQVQHRQRLAELAEEAKALAASWFLTATGSPASTDSDL